MVKLEFGISEIVHLNKFIIKQTSGVKDIPNIFEYSLGFSIINSAFLYGTYVGAKINQLNDDGSSITDCLINCLAKEKYYSVPDKIHLDRFKEGLELACKDLDIKINYSKDNQ